MRLDLLSTVVDSQNVEWRPTRYPGVEFKLLFEDKESGLFTGLFRWAPGAELPYHEHVEVEQTYILEGTLEDHEGAIAPGMFAARPGGSRHIARSPNGCLHISFFLKPNLFFSVDGSAKPFER
ncbi:cupin domain-containing protein [Bordetella sp. BOR01]|nr:cupin domain-containing protein [Bordetella sp. BOR01]